MKQETPPEMMYRRHMTADPARLARIRHDLYAHLLLWGRECLAADLAMCVTELLSNVHRHVDPPDCELALHNLPEGVRAAVSDRSRVLPTVRRPSALDAWAEHGRGMLLVSETADRWGATLTPTGKQVWVLLRDSGAAGGAGAVAG